MEFINSVQDHQLTWGKAKLANLTLTRALHKMSVKIS